jgi:arsenate reductase
MAEGFLKSFDSTLEVFSAGTNPASRISSRAIQVMKEINIDISGGFPNSVDRYTHESFDYVITVCDHARESCPVFTGNVGTRLHIGFDDPAMTSGTPEEVLQVFRRVRDEMKEQFDKYYRNHLFPKENSHGKS